MGKAEATSRELMLQAFNVKGADGWVKVEVSKNLSTAFGGIKGYIPQGMNLTVLSDSYLKAVDVMSGAALTPTK
jgi:hypothetical protein